MVNEFLQDDSVELLGLGSVSSTVSAAATELTNVLTDIVIWDNSNGREATKVFQYISYFHQKIS